MRSRGVLDQKYIFEYEVGHFAFGSCQVLRDRSGNTMRNCKVVPKSIIQNPHGVVERLNQLKGLQGTHIASVTDVMEDPTSLFIVSEFCAGGDIGDWMDRLDDGHLLEEQTCAAYVRQALLALSQSHASNIFHRDLQPQNILLTSKLPDATVKVNDIGVAAILDPDGAIMQRQTNPYVAPEIRDGSEPAASGAADMWSVGAIAHQLIVGAAPNDGASGGVMGWFSGKRNFEDVWAERSPASRDFVESLLQPDPNQRATAARALQHPWLKSLVPLAGAQWNADTEASRDIRHKTLCYILAVLLIPVLVPFRDFEQLRHAFVDKDTDNDGLNSDTVVLRILLTRCALNEAVTPALSIMDIGETGTVDLCATACADLVAREFFAGGPTGQPLSGPFRATDLAPRMLKRFFEVFGERKQPTSGGTASVDNIRTRLRTATARDMERYAGVSYTEILDPLPENRVVDSQVLTSVLSANACQGTPLGISEFDPVRGSEGRMGDFNDGIMSFFQTCGVQREESPHSINVTEDHEHMGRRRGGY